MNNTNTPDLLAMPVHRLQNTMNLLDRLQGFIGAIRDTIEIVSSNDRDFSSRLYVVDYVDAELQRIRNDLGKTREMVRAA